eukprot:PLAT10424.1.p1 GENE.PLAT10424.1~~PLAT10424.1.p1  ORF type:complete len:404 (+),score=151.88 PLAT10424.1:135-1214(+)
MADMMGLSADDSEGGKSEMEEEDAEDDEGEEGGEDEEEEEEAVPVSRMVQLELPESPPGQRVGLEGATIAGISVCQIYRLALQLRCERCSLQLDVVVSADESYDAWCRGCSVRLTAILRVDITHSGHLTLGWLETRNCGAADFLPSSFLAGCEDCGDEYLLEDCIRVRPSEKTCISCHNRLHLEFRNVRFYGDEAGSRRGGGSRGRMLAGRKKVRNASIVPGRALPKNGACKHYRRSLRWFRFPCCGKAYPCDICHDSDESHPAMWASHIICGFCAREQRATNKECSSCSAALGPVASKRHWEGGKGCRDKTRMDRRDSRKYRNSKLKTRSRKAKRSADAKRGKKRKKQRGQKKETKAS